jgi:GTP pyrophosphokinase
MTPQDQNLITELTSYNPQLDPKSIEQAIDFARKMHEGQFRASGEPYYTHPVAVAGILADMKMDPVTIITAILHDTLEDTKATTEDLEKKFGGEVAQLVNGVSKLTKIESQTVEGKQAENFRKLVLAMSEDIRVLLVKLADRLHNMRTLGHVNADKCRRIARETLDIYAPLAERIGVHQIKEELEDLAFGYLQTEARDSITNRLNFLRQEGTDVVDTIIKEFDKLMKGAGIMAQVTGREKTRYSIWKKMQRKNISFEQLSDIMAFRVVVDNIEQCYHALGIIHSNYPVVPGRFKDFISTPKPNGYRSLHTTVIGPGSHRVEIQIRTKDMHREADLGVAAHWSYKQSDVKNAVNEAKKYRWLRELLDILEQDQRPEDFWENTKMELFQDQVFAFTPKGDLIELPSGATPVDFAYAIHSSVGDRCIGAKINGRIAPLNTKIQNGDQVDIVTSKTQNPSPTWERFVVTGKARSHIRRFIRQQQKTEYVTLGRAMLQKIFKTEGYEFTDKAVVGVVDKFRECENADDVYAGIGSGNIVGRDVFRAIFPSHKPEADKKVSEPEDIPTVSKNIHGTGNRESREKLPIVGLIPGMAVHFARCCHPLPGDRIVGIVTTGKGVTIHTIDCETLEQFADTPERWLDVSWGEGQEMSEERVGRLSVTIANQAGTLGTLSTVIGKSGGNISNLKITNRSSDFWDMFIDVAVQDTKHLNNIIAALRATPQIISVERSRGK